MSPQAAPLRASVLQEMYQPCRSTMRVAHGRGVRPARLTRSLPIVCGTGAAPGAVA